MCRKVVVFLLFMVWGPAIVNGASAQSAFDGAYIGGQGGYSAYDISATVTGVGSASDTADGFGYGAFFGYGFANGPLYGAIEGEVGIDGAEFQERAGTSTVTVEADLTYGIHFRAGYIWADRYLGYVRVGWQRTEYDASATGQGSASETFNGFRVGGGVEGQVSGPLFIRAEYTFTDYEDFDDVPNTTIDFEQHLFRIGAGYRF